MSVVFGIGRWKLSECKAWAGSSEDGEGVTTIAMLSVGFYTDWVRNAVLSSGLVVTYGQETAKFVCGSPGINF